MITLGINTSTQTASAAIIQNGKVLSCSESRQTLCHDELASIIRVCLKNADKTIHDLEAVGIVVGPGSFTGLRIGISFVMGLCFGRNLLAVPLSTLQVLAFSVNLEDGKTIRSVMDARRNEGFTSLFKKNNGQLTRLEEDRLETIQKIADLDADILTGIGCEKLFTGSSRPYQEIQNVSMGISTALLAESNYPKHAVTAKELRPVYIRKSSIEEKKENAIGSFNWNI
jgi:tRNA threonylcarbamoyladenosine biosynthesis protein TsaB